MIIRDRKQAFVGSQSLRAAELDSRRELGLIIHDAKAVHVLTKELDPLAVSVKKAVMTAVAKSGEDILHDKHVKHTMKQVVKKAAKEAVKEAVENAQEAENPGSQRSQGS